MNVYLAKFELNGKVAYKIGHSKHTFRPDMRFMYEQYKKFEKVSIVTSIQVCHEDWYTAKTKAIKVEEGLQRIYKKNFFLEDYFGVPGGTFNGLSGITEMFILEEGQSEEDIIQLYYKVDKVINKRH